MFGRSTHKTRNKSEPIKQEDSVFEEYRELHNVHNRSIRVKTN